MPKKEEDLKLEEGKDDLKKDEEEEEEEEVKTEDEEFAEAFDEAIAEDDPDHKKKDSAEVDDGDVEPEADADTKLPKKDEKAKDGDGDGSDDYLTKYEETLAENQKLNQKMRSWEGRITAANKRAEEAEQKLQQTAKVSTQDKDALPDGDDDEKVLKDFVEEFPSLEKPIKTMVKKLSQTVVDAKIKELAPQFAKLEGIEETLLTNTEKLHWATIEDAHADWKEIRDTGKLNEWIGQQPSFVKTAMEQVANEGSAAQVVEMLDLYKESIGEDRSTSTQRGSKKAKKKKVQGMIAVDGASGGAPKIKGKISEDDFDGAWDDALRSE